MAEWYYWFNWGKGEWQEAKKAGLEEKAFSFAGQQSESEENLYYPKDRPGGGGGGQHATSIISYLLYLILL
jgi:hypothetical protein